MFASQEKMNRFMTGGQHYVERPKVRLSSCLPSNAGNWLKNLTLVSCRPFGSP